MSLVGDDGMKEAEVLARRLCLHAEKMAMLIDDIQAHQTRESFKCYDGAVDAVIKSRRAADMRAWIDAGKMDVRKGIMCLQRALYPDTFF